MLPPTGLLSKQPRGSGSSLGSRSDGTPGAQPPPKGDPPTPTRAARPRYAPLSDVFRRVAADGRKALAGGFGTALSFVEPPPTQSAVAPNRYVPVNPTPKDPLRVALRMDAVAGRPLDPDEAIIEVRFPFSALQGVAIGLARFEAAASVFRT
ncbi:hypothetical protein FNF27_02860 [Cafeteria roenbergensis]|uniref:Uncharacterized protein n=2 Tax=Cafeteria roenbergensis TaxID=33653 RepID=A0A5A8CL41_CAFRO|nr:hypothetical protein FNF29_03235 [Cafeteria roenbergensis]KAA0161131.1 hypothetical protein FNF31_03972 [Cafeteria roenbergensis]KAA0170854.1 hypothetical protein FNF28_01127 [Cafeteria roenbergensis]KAA0175774.1 hypothetical protein FNF27_02860 [Cafeteria roenbergensis]|eukprot:KAA0153418.1 hypothetical protein FNF29_03235 [Cafeteria roenbergensis]